MNQALKQRLIGAIVLFCLALILIPLLLDGKGVAPPAMQLDLPPRPALAALTIPEPERPVLVTDSSDASGSVPQLQVPPFVEEAKTPAPAKTEPAPKTVETKVVTPAAPTVKPTPERVPARDTAGLPQGWVVRLGTFGERANADRLLKQLLDAKYKAYAESVASAQGALTGVYVGPVLTRAEADSLQRELNKRFQLEGLVRRFSLNEGQ
ncbi:MAG: SPOR domain-containing protein [Pseudomonadales bacterium]|nr:SPOR domain-containing protein [Pseudomonadales bacterium]